VEVAKPNEPEGRLMPFAARLTDSRQTIFNYVPVSVVRNIIAAHGGISSGHLPPMADEGTHAAAAAAPMPAPKLLKVTQLFADDSDDDEGWPTLPANRDYSNTGWDSTPSDRAAATATSSRGAMAAHHFNMDETEYAEDGYAWAAAANPPTTEESTETEAEEEEEYEEATSVVHTGAPPPPPPPYPPTEQTGEIIPPTLEEVLSPIERIHEKFE